MADGKTNAMRILEQKGMAYTAHTYPHGKEAVDGESVAKLTGQDPARVFKTLVTKGHSGQHYVFVVPVEEELHLKKAAAAVGEKSVSMVAVKDLLPLTGYVRGGCSPVGMKKPFPTVLAMQAREQTAILVSGGKIGIQIELAPRDLLAAIGGKLADITIEQ